MACRDISSHGLKPVYVTYAGMRYVLKAGSQYDAKPCVA